MAKPVPPGQAPHSVAPSLPQETARLRRTLPPLTQGDHPPMPQPMALSNSGLFRPLIGLIIALSGILLSGVSAYFWPQHQTTLAASQIVLVAVSFFLITRIALCMRKNLLTPLAQLREWAQHMRKGDLSARVPETGQGEFSALARDINQLGDSLRTLSREMDEQVKQQTITLQRKTRSLEILYDVAARSNTAKDIDELLIAYLNTLTEIVYAHAGSVRLMTDDRQMRLVGSVGLDDSRLETIRTMPIEHCLCAQEFSKNMLVCQNRFEHCENAAGDLLFPGDKLENIAIPLRYNNRTLGIYNLFVEKLGLAEREDIKDILTNIGQHLSMAIAKAHWDAESHRLSIMQERTMLAHELHDSLAQTLASLRFRVSMLQQTLAENETAGNRESGALKEVAQIKTGLDEANFELRELLSHFRIRMDERGLIPATEGLVERFKNESNCQIFFQNECPDLRLPPMLEVHLLHIIQEALANIRKHSQAHYVRILMDCEDAHSFHLLIEDDGIGIDAQIDNAMPGEHAGLSIMQERAQRIGAELTIESEPGEGTRVELLLAQAQQTANP